MLRRHATGFTGSVASSSDDRDGCGVLTIFTVPKPFEGHVGIIQKNAIGSWKRLRPECQVILCGDEPGTKEVAAELGAKWVPAVERNEFGTPLVSSVFRLAEERAAHRVLCYVNADIVLLSDFIAAGRTVAAAKRRFLMVGQRWDLDITEQLALDDDWEAQLRERVKLAGTLHPAWGSDYFVYPRGTIGPLPPFAVGRPGWDNWMIYRARSRRIAVVDASACTVVIHQNHDYGHVRGGTGGTFEGPEAVLNLALIGDASRLFTPSDATHRLTSAGLDPLRGWTIDDLKRRVRAEGRVLAPRPLRAVYRALVRAKKVLWGS